ncbi:MAG: DNA primase [Hydrogenophilaceae bacterium]|nr:DNA primase [Hydrogenophilaceae bacterium]
MIPQDFIQTLLDRVDIVDVIERYVPLKKAGINYQARCPFHNEKTPSFTVSPTKQFYHCFGCGAHGTAITFLMQHTGMGFVEAVKELSARVGMAVPDDGTRSNPEDGRREHLYELMETAAHFYKGELKTHAAAVAYLKNRGLTGETAVRYGLGYAPDDWQGLARAVADYQDKALEEAGLVIAGEGGKRYDRFRHRVMFPIKNERGKVIAFGGRVLDKAEPKYLNSPETPLFHKGRELYGLHEGRKAIQSQGRVIVVEGYMDVVMLAQHGVENAVATLGTAVTSDQVERLLRLADAIVFAFDGDAAGRKAAWRALENSLPQVVDGKRLGFLFLPEGEDPDSYVRAQGRAAFEQLLDKAVPLSQFLLDEMTAKTDLASPEGRVRLVKLTEPYLDQMRRAPLLARSLRRQLAGMSGMAGRDSGRSSTRFTPGPATASIPKRGGQPSPYRVVLQALIHKPERVAQLPAELPVDASPEAAVLASAMASIRQRPDIPSSRQLVESFRDRSEQALMEAAEAAVLVWEAVDHDVESDFRGALATLQEQAGRQQAKTLSHMRPSEMSPEEKARFLESLKAKKLSALAPVEDVPGQGDLTS